MPHPIPGNVQAFKTGNGIASKEASGPREAKENPSLSRRQIAGRVSWSLPGVVVRSATARLRHGQLHPVRLGEPRALRRVYIGGSTWRITEVKKFESATSSSV
ncbi:hypothetical protein Celaphus_00009548 [Cervus elaphus hippelaphus]|uniref:Uncharacterized protein n=1 Tax=Cervus elaphus hippelaphus TaxID=46360 RepID=A0A212C0G7_CEREH|nr:hypothetical protein Celaphus_00009548 [Cervus elaphus hippelaphus]